LPQITGIEAQKKRSGRYSIFVDGLYGFSLSENDLIATGLHNGQELGLAELGKMRALSARSKLLEKTYRLISYRKRSEAELRRYLKDLSEEKIDVEDVIEQLRRQGLVDDGDFAGSWIKDRQNLRPRSRRRLEAELRAKGLDTGVIHEAVERISDDDEIAVIKGMVMRKRRLSKYRDKKKLSQYLVQQGFDFNLVNRAMKELSEEDGFLGNVT
jgi:regulatory protein